MSGQYLSAARGQSAFDALNIGSRQLVPHAGHSFLCVKAESGLSRSVYRFRLYFFGGLLLLHRRLFRLVYGGSRKLRFSSGKAQPLRDIGEHLTAFFQGVIELTFKQLHESKVIRCTSSMETALGMSDLSAQRFQLHPLEFAHRKLPDDWDAIAAWRKTRYSSMSNIGH